MDNTEEIIRKYYGLGLQQNEILMFLNIVHNIEISHTSLKRRLKDLRLYRRKHYSNINAIVTFLLEQIGKSGQMHGYGWMHLKCLQNGLTVTQNVVREFLKILDPQGVEIRTRRRLRRRQYYSKGPNYLWHLDSYDKLKPYGICINGCMDGYSRHIIWLRAGNTSSDPKVIAGYFLDTIETLGGHPRTIRSDMGIENGSVQKIQELLYDIVGRTTSGVPPFIYGRSPANQRIQSWWSILRKHNAQYWMNLFEMLKDNGWFNGTFLDKSLIQYCFLAVIQRELRELVLEWNIHKIRKSRNSVSPMGRPMILFEIPEMYGSQDYLYKFPISLVDYLEEYCVRHEYPCDEDVFNLCEDLVAESRYRKTDDNPYDAVQLYINLRTELYSLL